MASDTKYNVLELPTLIRSWSNLEGSQKTRELVNLARSGPVEQVEVLLQKLEEVYDQGQISSSDFCLVLAASLSLNTAIHVLRSRKEPSLLSSATTVIRRSSRKSIEDVLSACHGISGLVEIISNLSLQAANRMLRTLSKSHDPNVEPMADSLIKAAVPFLNSSSVLFPLRHIKLIVMKWMVPLASSSLLYSLLPRLPEPLSPATWTIMTAKKPDLVSEFLLIRLGIHQNVSSEWHKSGTVNSTSNWYTFFPTKPEGINFLQAFYKKYSGVSENIQTKLNDIFQSRPLFLAGMDKKGFIGGLFASRKDRGQDLAWIMELLSVFKTIKAKNWDWEDISPFLPTILKIFGRSKEEWVLLNPDQWMVDRTSDGATISKAIHGLFKTFNSDSFSLSRPNIELIRALESLPLDARFSFLERAYFACFTESILDKEANTKPISAILMFLVGQKHGATLLQLRTSIPSGITISALPYSYSSLSIDAFSESYNLAVSTREHNTGHFGSAESIVFRAAWVGVELRGIKFGQSRPEITVKGIEELQDDIVTLKGRAARGSDSKTRFSIVNLIFNIALHIQDAELVMETLTWVKQRFLKDPQLRDAFLFPFIRKANNGFIDLLSKSFNTPFKQQEAGVYVTALDTYIQNIDKSLTILHELIVALTDEPSVISFRYNAWNAYNVFLWEVVQKRIEFMDALPKGILNHSGLMDALFKNITPLLLRHGPKDDYIPRKAYVVLTSLRLRESLHKIIPWLDEFGMKRHELYSIQSATKEGALPLPFGEAQTFWPSFVLPPVGLKYSLGFDFEDTHYTRYLELNLFASRTSLLSTTPSLEIGSIFQDNLSCYLAWSSSRGDTVRKITRLLEHYGPGVKGEDSESQDLSLILFENHTISNIVLDSPATFVPRMLGVLPVYPATAPQPCYVLFNPLTNIPDIPESVPGTILAALTGLITKTSRISIFDRLLHYTSNFTKHNKVLHSLKIAQAMAVLITAGISTALSIPLAEDTVTNGPISYALRYVRCDDSLSGKALYDSIIGRSLYDSDYGKYWHYGMTAYHLSVTLAYIDVKEVKLLVDAILAMPMDPIRRGISISLIKQLRGRIPELAIDLAFPILNDTDSSSWHRQVLTRDTFSNLRPVDISVVMRRFCDHIASRRKLQLENDARIKEVEQSGITPKPSSTAILKISTIKMFFQLLSSAFHCGLSLTDGLTLARDVVEVSTHHSVLEVFIQVVIERLCLESIWSDDDLSDPDIAAMLKILAPYVQISIRLDERKSLEGTDWEAIRLKDAPMPDVDDSHSIANVLLSQDISTLPLNLQTKWLEEFTVPIIVGQIANRTEWLKTAFLREGGSIEDVDHIRGFPCNNGTLLTVFQQVMVNPYYSQLAKNTTKALLDLIDYRLFLRRVRKPFTYLVNALNTNHRDAKKDQQSYLETARLLYSPARSDDSRTFDATVHAVLNVALSPIVDPELLVLLNDMLERVSLNLLLPDASFEGHNPNVKVAPFAAFQAFCDILSRVTNKNWHGRIRPILVKCLEYAERYEKELSSTVLYGGASYWPVIVSLKTALLPSPSCLPHSQAADKYSKYANALAGLADEILKFPDYHLLLPHLFKRITDYRCPSTDDIFDICHSLTSSAITDNYPRNVRVICFQMAQELHLKRKAGKGKARKEMADMLRQWRNDDDAVIRLLSY